MIVDLEAFCARERPLWQELEGLLLRLERQPTLPLSVPEVERLHYVYRRAVSALAKVGSMPRGTELGSYLETLVARAYVELHDTRAESPRPVLLSWLRFTVPATFWRHLRAFGLAVIVTLVGAAFGAGALVLDDDAKNTLLPFSHLQGGPRERVRHEEAGPERGLEARHSTFAAALMVNNIQVGIRALALGVFLGIGTLIILFYNGVILGAVTLDYVRAGETEFLLGWLLPHGSVEIPAFILAGQAGLMLGHAMMGRGDGAPLSERLRRLAPDLVTMICAVALLLVWAGLIESFFSQYHEPIIPYPVKIVFGLAELALLAAWLGRRPALPDSRAAALRP